MKTTQEERDTYKGQSRTRRINNLINRMEQLHEGTRVGIEEIDAALEQNRHVLESTTKLIVQAIRRAN
jgi:hypothetical protein